MHTEAVGECQMDFVTAHVSSGVLVSATYDSESA